MNVLITSAGQRVSLLRAFRKEIKKINKNGKVYAVDLNPVLSPACQVADDFAKVKRVTEPDYISDLLEVCKKWNIKIVIPTIDSELKVLASHRSVFEKEGIYLIVADLKFVNICRDKRLTNQFFTENGISIPVQYDKNNLQYPLFIKPFDGSLSKDIYLVNNQKELSEKHLSNEKFMYMEYIQPQEHDEYTVDTYYDKHGYLKCTVPRKRIFVRSGEVNKGVTRKNRIFHFIHKKLKYIEGARGCLTLQFFLNKRTERIVGIEINPRFGGGYPLSYLANANYPKWILNEYLLNKTISTFSDWEENLLMLRYDDEILISGYEEV